MVRNARVVEWVGSSKVRLMIFLARARLCKAQGWSILNEKTNMSLRNHLVYSKKRVAMVKGQRSKYASIDLHVLQ